MLQLVRNRKKIFSKYLRSWLVIDVISVAPSLGEKVLELVSGSHGHAAGFPDADFKVLKILRMLRLAKLIRLSKMQRLMKKYSEDLGAATAIVKLVALLLIILWMAHIISCGWYYLGHQSSLRDGEFQTGWVHQPMEDIVWTRMSLGLQPDEFAVANATMQHQYLHCFWWALAILLAPALGPGGIEPATPREVVFTMLMEILGVSVIGVIIGKALSFHCPSIDERHS